MVALRLGVASAWTAVVAAELIGAPSGLGYAVEWYRELLMTPQVMAFIATIGVLGYLCDSMVRALARWLTPWSADARRSATMSALQVRAADARRVAAAHAARRLAGVGNRHRQSAHAGADARRRRGAST